MKLETKAGKTHKYVEILKLTLKLPMGLRRKSVNKVQTQHTKNMGCS